MEVLRVFCRILFKLFVRTTVFYPEKVPAEGPVVLVSNHESMLDMFMIGYRLPRYLKWMAKSELFKFRPVAKLLRYWGAYPVKRGTRDKTALQTTTAFLEAGEIVGIFPQGTRSRGRGRSLPVKPGFVRFAAESDAVIQPVAIWGKIRLFGKVYVRFGEPFSAREALETTDHTENREAIHALAERTMDDIYNMMEVPLEFRKS